MRAVGADMGKITKVEKIEAGFPFRSSHVRPETIQAITESCPEDNCALSVTIRETTLMAGEADWYDKQGTLHIDNPNHFTADVCCQTCGQAWRIRWDNYA